METPPFVVKKLVTRPVRISAYSKFQVRLHVFACVEMRLYSEFKLMARLEAECKVVSLS